MVCRAQAMSQPEWGGIQTRADGTGVIELEIRSWPSDGKLPLPPSFPEIASARMVGKHGSEPLKWFSSQIPSASFVFVSSKQPDKLPAKILVEPVPPKSTQFADGRITFSLNDAKAGGADGGNTTNSDGVQTGIGKDSRSVREWDYQPTRWGMYDVEVTGSSAGLESTELRVEVAGRHFIVKQPSISVFAGLHTSCLVVGRVYLDKAQPFAVKTVSVSPMPAGNVNIGCVTLRPAPEGVAITQTPDGVITLAASNGITRSVTMRYEPATNKNCMGYWVNPHDSAEWQFTVLKPGAYEVELWQGCKGGGSEVAVDVGGKRLTFTVEDTGHFQNFKPRKLGEVEFGRAGLHSLKVQPLTKKGAAVMDIREVRLTPVGGPVAVPKRAVKVEVDFSAAPECEAFAKRAGKLVEEWFPRLRELLASEGEPPLAEVVKLSFVPMKGVASTSGSHIKVSADWVTKRAPNDYGMVIHELVHVVQDYQGTGEGWVTEGIADYVRDRWFEPGARTARINPDQASYRDGYTTAGAFLMWIEDHKCREIVPMLNAASRQRKPVLAVFPALTGQDVDALWHEFIAARRTVLSNASR